MRTDVEARALSDYDTATRQIAANKPNDNQSEGAYGLAYQRLVVLGLAQSIKKKYRAR